MFSITEAVMKTSVCFKMIRIVRTPMLACLIGSLLIVVNAFGSVGVGDTKRRLIVRADHNYPPYEFIQNSRPTGFNIDMIKAVAEVMGIDIHIIPGPWSEVRNDLETGKIDILAGMYYSKERDHKVDFSNPHIIVSHAVFVRKGSLIRSFEDIRGKKILVQRGDIMHDFAKSNLLSDHLIPVDDQIDALKLLSSGNYDCALLAKLQGVYLIRSHRLTNIETVGFPIQPRKYCFAVTDGNAQFVAQLNEGLSLLKSSGKYDEIYQQWFGHYDDKIAYRRILRYAVYALIMMLLLMGSILFWLSALKSQVAVKTRELSKELNDRIEAENALKASESVLKATLESPFGGVLVVSGTGQVSHYNSEFCKIWNIPDDLLAHKEDKILIDYVLSQLEDPQSFMAKVEALYNGSDTSVDSIRFKDGRIVERCSYPLKPGDNKSGRVWFFQDITNRLQMEEQLLQSQKIESIGTLAGGVAHDFNNILGIILGNTELALDDVPDWNPAKHSIEEIKTASLRAKAVVRQLLSFSRKADHELQPLKIIPIIKESLTLLRASIPASIEIRQNIPEDCPTILADPTQIHQIMINLSTNAAHAMQEQGGILEVSVDDIELSISENDFDTSLPTGKYVRLIVCDTGTGIRPEIKDLIFDPYFTTKEIGKGTGMGLAVVHGIVKSLDGGIFLESEPGIGSTFTLYFRGIPEKPIEKKESLKKLPTGDERLLLVDDEASIIDVGERILTRLGYQVETETNPVNALTTFRSDPKRFDLVILDMTMPHMTGDKLAEEILATRPGMPIVLCSGYSEKMESLMAQESGIQGYVMKPIIMNEIAHTVRHVLDAESVN